MDNKERELLCKIVETWGNGAINFSEREQWLKDYAKQNAIAFMNWSLQNDCSYIVSDEDQWTNILNTDDIITTEQLYDKFIEQQLK